MKHIESILFSGTLSSWKLEAIANCATVFAQRMYIAGSYLAEGLDFFVENYEETDDKEYSMLLLYTIKQIVQNLNQDSEARLVY